SLNDEVKNNVAKNLRDLEKAISDLTKKAGPDLNTLGDKADQCAKKLKTFSTDATNAMKDLAKNIGTQMTSAANDFTKGLNTMQQNATTAMSNITSTMSKNTSQFLTQLQNLFTGAFNNIAVSANNAMVKAYNAIVDGINQIAKMMAGAKLQIGNYVILPHFYMSGEFNAKTGAVPNVGVKWYDKGGVFDRPTIIGVGERRPEFVGALDDLREIVRDESNTANVTINVYGSEGQDIYELGDIIMERIQANINRREAAFA
ncbi:MAG: hypothetical protein IJ153_06070, partial [Clostridia bacterium]|nr:hypothetical protein [Clostridia bacterium]